MEFKQYGKILTDPQTTFKPRELVEGIVLRRLNFLIEFLTENKPEILDSFIALLSERLEAQLSDIPHSEMPFSLEEYSYLQDQPELVDLHWRLCLQQLGLAAEQVSPNNELTISSSSHIRAFLLPRYTHLVLLDEMLGKEAAVALFKEYLNQYLLSVQALIPQDYDLEALRSRELGEDTEDTENGWLITVSNVEDGQVVFRNDNCLWVEALEEVEDKDYLYLVCCYSDFQFARMKNEHFELTMPKAIAMGDPICDKVFHDKRIVEKVVHPPQEFWDSINVEVS